MATENQTQHNSAKKEVDSNNFTVEKGLVLAMKAPGVRINRAIFLQKELKGRCSEEECSIAIEKNPAKAGIPVDVINKIAKQVIRYETDKVSAISFAAGIPGGIAMVGTVTVDIIQYFGFILRVMQKLAYLYGFEQFDLNEDEINDETMNKIMFFLGVMFGVQAANAGIKIIAESAAKKASRTLAQKALNRGTIYPIVKAIAKSVGLKMSRQIFANGVSKIVPVVGGVLTGGLTYATFKPCAKRLQKSLQGLNLCNPEYYKHPENFKDETYEDIDIDIDTETEQDIE